MDHSGSNKSNSNAKNTKNDANIMQNISIVPIGGSSAMLPCM